MGRSRMRYFEGLSDEREIKVRYKELAKEHHPDKGGCSEVMKEINNQYEDVIRGCYQLAGKSITEIDELLSNDAVMREKLSAILLIDGIVIELCGSWLWVTGDTMSCKARLKELGFFWAVKKRAWYFHTEEKKRKYRKGMELNLIREKYGSQAIKKKNWYIS